ncbi:MAG: T9SS type A sorting domain-containing protein, partial [Bacteroidales bacterium]
RINPPTYFILNNNLDTIGSSDYEAIASASANMGLGWTPIGDGTIKFTGNFNGNGHTINGLYIDHTIWYAGVAIDPLLQENIGLFGTIGSGAVISNIGLTNVTIAGKKQVGGLVGVVEGGTVTNAYVTGSVRGEENIGGMAGKIISGTITNAYSTTDVDGINYVGGLIGDIISGTVTNAYSLGSVTGDYTYVGGLVGRNSTGTFNNCFWDTQFSGQSSSAGGTGKNAIEMKTQSTFTDWDFTSGAGKWQITQAVSGYRYCPCLQSFSYDVPGTAPAINPLPGLTWTYSGGEGTSGSPFQITTLTDLHFLSEQSYDWSKYFIQTANIDAVATSGWDTGFGFSPIGNGTDTFTGNYNGNYHTITGLYINRPAKDDIGMFGYVSSSGCISNLGLVNVAITGHENVGGLIGYFNAATGSIANTYVTGQVSAQTDVGGLSGEIWDGTLTDVYSTASVTGNRGVGGLVGATRDNITNAYSSGLVTGSTYVGGLIGWKGIYSTVDNSFWDKETSGQNDSWGGTGKTTAEMKLQSTFISWDFTAGTGDWQIKEIASLYKSYPYLQGYTYDEPGALPVVNPIPGLADLYYSGGIGTVENPYQIKTLEDLHYLSANIDDWEKYFIQTANIDATATSGWNSGAGFVPIGSVTLPFTGNYNGNAHTIDGLFINRPSNQCIGLFGYVNTSNGINDLGLTNITIMGKGYVGGLVGATYLGTFTNVYTSGLVGGSESYVGGLVGVIFGGTLTGAYSTGTVSGFVDCTGGLAGVNYGSIGNSYSTANVSGSASYVAGLVALNTGTITNSYATGLVTDGSSYVGGLVGGITGTVSSSFWDTETSGQTTSAGGEGKTTAEMTNALTFVANCWDFQAETGNGTDDYWGVDATDNSGYPFLSWQGYTNTATYPSTITLGTTTSPTCGWSISSGVLSASMDVSIHVDDIKTALTSGNLTIEASDEIIIDAAIAPALTQTRTLTMKAGGNITMSASSSIVPSTEFALNTIFWSDSDSTSQGAVTLNNSASINTKGGHLWIGGGSGSAAWNGLIVGNGCAKSTSGDAVALKSAIVSTSGGDIQIKGESTATAIGSDGISISSGSTILVGAGNISLYGIGGQALGAEADCDGIRLDGPITTTAGNITLTGASTTEGLNEGIAIQSYITSTSGNISLITNIFWMDAASRIESSRTLTLKPLSDGSTIGIAADAGMLNLPAAYFTTNFVNGFSGITVGSGTAGNISITALPFNDPVTFNAAGNLNLENDIDLNGQTIILGNEITLNEASGRFYGASGNITTTRDLSNISSENVAGLGAFITTAADMGITTITRGHTNQSWDGNNSILRYYDITPTNSTGLNATLVFNYSDAELNSLNEAKLFLYKSTDGGTTYSCEGGTVNTTANTITLSGIGDFSRWMAAEIMTLNWNGTGSDFNTSTNWTLNKTPSSLYNLNIINVGSSPIVNEVPGSPAVCNDLTIASGAELTIAPGKALNVNGTFTNSGTLTIQSSIVGTGSLIAAGNSTGSITSQCYFPGPLQSWHMVSAPVATMGIEASGFEPGNNDDFYTWHEPSPGTWVNYKTVDPEQNPTFVAVNGNDNFIPGKGYLVAYNEAAPIKTFSGTLNTGSQTFTLKNSSSKDWTYSLGWNLLGNPYSSAIDWHEADRNLFLDEFAYAYNPQGNEGAGAYVAIDGSNENAYIAANQGFFVIAKTTSNDQQFTFTNAMQTHGGTYFKNTDENDKLVLRLSGDLYYDETTIRQRDESTFNKDRVDAFKMNSFNVNAPNVYSISEDNINLAINSIPEIGSGHTIRMGMLAPKSGLYKIQVVEASSYMMDNNIYLEDQLLSKWHKISENVYSFTTEAVDIADRFVIHFGVVGVEETMPLEEQIQLWTNNNTLNVHNPENMAGELRLYNMFGQIVEHISLNRNPNQQINLVVPDGFYVVNIETSQQIINKKVYLR